MTPKEEQIQSSNNDRHLIPGEESPDTSAPASLALESQDVPEQSLSDVSPDDVSGISAESLDNPAPEACADDTAVAGSGPLPLSEEEIAALHAVPAEKSVSKGARSPYEPVPFLRAEPMSSANERGVGYYERSGGYWGLERDAKLLTPHKARPRYHRYEVRKKAAQDNTLGFPSFLGTRDWEDDYASIPKPEGLEDFRIVIEPTAWLKMSRLIAACDVEVAWNAFVRVEVADPVVRLVVYDIFVPTQIGRPATFDVSASGKAESLYAYFSAAQLTQAEIGKRMADLKFHGHSHVWMGTSPSGVDNTYIRGVLEKANPLFYIRAIANKAGRLELSLYLLQYSLKISDMPWSIGWDQFDEIDGWATQEVKEKVTREEFHYQPRVPWAWQQEPTTPRKAAGDAKIPELPVIAKNTADTAVDSPADSATMETTALVGAEQDQPVPEATSDIAMPEEPQKPVVTPEPPALSPQSLWQKLRAWWDAPVRF